MVKAGSGVGRGRGAALSSPVRVVRASGHLGPLAQVLFEVTVQVLAMAHCNIGANRKERKRVNHRRSFYITVCMDLVCVLALNVFIYFMYTSLSQ